MNLSMKNIVLFISIAFFSLSATAAAPQYEVEVYKDPGCGCCTAWAKHLEENGFKIKNIVEDPEMNKRKNRLEIPYDKRSCHTAVINGYAFEGHVPANAIKIFLQNPPEGTKGLTVPNMPMGSPGMEYGDQKDPYTVFSFKGDGSTQSFMSY